LKKHKETPNNHNRHPAAEARRGDTSNPTTLTEANLMQPTIGPAKRNYTGKVAKVSNTNKVAKHPLDQPTAAAKHPPTTTTTAKQPSEQHSDKASANQHDLEMLSCP